MALQRRVSAWLLCTVYTASLAAATAAPPSPCNPCYYYDARYVGSLPTPQAQYEEMHLIAALAGLANRAHPTLYYVTQDIDVTWLQLLSSSWLSGSSWVNVTGIVPLVQALNATYAGIVLYDSNAWPSSLIASTAAGAEDLLPVCYRPSDPSSLYSTLVLGEVVPVKRSLVGVFNASGTGSIKLNAYTWAINEFITSGASDASVLGYYLDYYWTTRGDVPDGIDKMTVSNHDYIIANRGFLFDLSVWTDEAPDDDPNQPLGSDHAAFAAMLHAAYDATNGSTMIHISGFTPWAYKYVDAKHGGVPTEWQTSQFVSSYNAYVDADACCIGNMANAAFYQHYPLAERYVQAGPPTRAELIESGLLNGDGTVPNKLYYMFYAGDYDSAAWLYSQALPRWQDPVRGQVPLGWGFDPELSLRFPVIWDLVYAQASGNDTFITGDSGPGYINPTQLYGAARASISGLPDGRSTWVDFATPFYRQFGMTFTGFIITGYAPEMDSTAESMYVNMSGNGMVNQGWPDLTTHLASNVPVFTQTDLGADVNASAQEIVAAFTGGRPQFHMFRSVLTSPSFLQQVQAAATSMSSGSVVAVGPLALSVLARVVLGGSNDDRVTYVSDTLPSTAGAGAVLAWSATVRNDGWNVLQAENHSLLVSVPSVTCLQQTRRSPRSVGHMTAPQRLHGFLRMHSRVSANPAHRARAWARLGLEEYSVASSATPTLFPFPMDAPISGNVTVSATVTLPTLQEACGASGAAALAEVTYQVAATSPDGSILYTFDANGNIPWVSMIALT